MKFVRPPFKGENKGHYTAGVISKGMLYVSGQLSIDPEAGVPRENVVFCRVYTPDVKYWGPINEVYAEFFGDHKPGRVVVSTTEMHFGCLVEIEAIAEVDED